MTRALARGGGSGEEDVDRAFLHQSSSTTYLTFFGCIAQLVEHWAFNLMVAGSSPAIPKPTLHETLFKRCVVAFKDHSLAFVPA